MKRGKAMLLAAAAVLVLTAGVWAASRLTARETRLTTFAMGSYVQQTVFGGKDAAPEAAASVTELENRISWRVEDSEIDRLNRNAEQESSAAVPVSEDTWAVLNVCVQIADGSGGAFDPTIAPASRLWDFDGDPRVPSREELAAALENVGYRGLLTEVTEDREYRAKLAPGCSLDLGAVGKGAACDAVIGSWKESGAARGIVAVGGSVGLYGEKPFGRTWTVAVRDPEEPSASASLGLLRLEEGCVSTSGNYEKTFTEDGKTYHHLLDPRTGEPAESGLVSVTVWTNARDGRDGARSDALSTACFVLGYEKSLPLLKEWGAEAVFVTEDRRVLVTDGLASAFALTSEDYTLAEGGGAP